MDLSFLQVQEIPCNMCGGRDARYLHTNCSLRVVRCNDCHLVYVNPQPTEEALRRYHAARELLHQEGWSSYFEHSPKQIGELWEERIVDLRHWAHIQEMRLLDIGCGAGDFLHYASGNGWILTGFEFAPTLAELGRQKYGLNVEVGDLLELNFQKTSFDVITMWHVLEHLQNPFAVLKRSFELMSAGGVLALEVPNLHFLVRKSYRFPLSITLHLYHFSPRTLSALVRKAGFEVLNCRLGNTGFLYSRRSKIYAKKLFYACSRVVESSTGINIGDSIRLYARKPLLTSR